MSVNAWNVGNNSALVTHEQLYLEDMIDFHNNSNTHTHRGYSKYTWAWLLYHRYCMCLNQQLTSIRPQYYTYLYLQCFSYNEAPLFYSGRSLEILGMRRKNCECAVITAMFSLMVPQVPLICETKPSHLHKTSHEGLNRNMTVQWLLLHNLPLFVQEPLLSYERDGGGLKEGRHRVVQYSSSSNPNSGANYLFLFARALLLSTL